MSPYMQSPTMTITEPKPTMSLPTLPLPTVASSPRIPIVDFSGWKDDAPREQRQAIAKQLIAACKEVGFVYITNHGVQQELLNEAFGWTKKLFDLSHEDKMRAPHPDGYEVHRGYSWPGLEKVSQVMNNVDDPDIASKLRQVRDCKESYEIGSEKSPDQPNVWLPEQTLPGFRAFMTSFYWQCFLVSRSLLRAMAVGLDLEDEDFFMQFHSGHNNQLRLLHYPPVLAADVENRSAARMPAHTDWGSITMLFQDDCGGLEVENPAKQGDFVRAGPVEGALVMNVGDLLERWTNNKLKSTLHRVALPPLEDRFTGAGKERMTRQRYSIPYFCSPDIDAVIECLPTCTDAANPPKYAPVNQGEYRLMRASVQYPKNGGN